MRREVDDNNKMNLILSAKAMNAIYNANESSRIKGSKLALEFWKNLRMFLVP